jgi:hypothetical protein
LGDGEVCVGWAFGMWKDSFAGVRTCAPIYKRRERVEKGF